MTTMFGRPFVQSGFKICIYQKNSQSILLFSHFCIFLPGKNASLLNWVGSVFCFQTNYGKLLSTEIFWASWQCCPRLPISKFENSINLGSVLLLWLLKICFFCPFTRLFPTTSISWAKIDKKNNNGKWPWNDSEKNGKIL